MVNPLGLVRYRIDCVESTVYELQIFTVFHAYNDSVNKSIKIGVFTLREEQ